MSNELIRPFVAADEVALALPALEGSSYGWTYVSNVLSRVVWRFRCPDCPIWRNCISSQRLPGVVRALVRLCWPMLALRCRRLRLLRCRRGLIRAESPHAQFLLHRGFSIEHIEWEMTLRRPEKVPNVDVALTQYPRDQAIPLFRGLYNAAFEPTAWYQPWLNDSEVLGDWRSGDQILFLEVADKPIGFVWARRPQRQVAELEPVGIIAAEQGKGFGRKLLVAALNHLALQQVHSVKLGVWATNQPAINLYRSLGFQKTDSRTYLSRKL